MPITNNVGVLNAYDHNGMIPVPAVPTDNPLCHHAAHCLAFEYLRGWMASGVSVDDYNNMEQTVWDTLAATLREEAYTRATLNPRSSEHMAVLTVADKGQAWLLGENYFEHGYTLILSGTSPPDKRNFEREDGISDS